MVAAGDVASIWRQDIMNHHDKIGQLHIYHRAYFCKVVQWYQLLCGKQERSSRFIKGNICVLDIHSHH